MAYYHVVHSSPALLQSTLFKLKSVLYFFSMVKFTIECWDEVEAKMKTDLTSWTCHSTLLAISGNRIQSTWQLLSAYTTQIHFPYSFIFPFIFILLSLIMSWPEFPLPPLPCCLPEPPPLSPRSTPLFSPQKRAGTAGKSTKHSMTNYDKVRYIPSHQGSTRQQSGRKRVPQSGKRIRDCPYPTFRESHHNTKLLRYSIYMDDLGQTPTDHWSL